MEKLTIHIPDQVEEILYTLNKANYEAYIVGGCVRDALMGKTPNDWDITTSATPELVKEVFPKTYDTGLKHGTVTVRIEDVYHEVTTYRTEGKYEDYRRPSTVEFVSDIKLDLGRRDFTINAIAYHPKEGYIDPYNGMVDIKKSLIQSVGDARERFTEDALRILRGVRFSAQLGFTIEEQTLAAMETCAGLLDHISQERIRDEMMKILMSDRPNKLIDMHYGGLLDYVLPELSWCFNTPQNHPHHIYNVGLHTIKAVEETPQDEVTRLAMLLHDIAKPATHTTDDEGIDHFNGHVPKGVEMSKRILRRLRFDNETIRQVTSLVKYHDFHIEEAFTKENIKEVLCEIGPDLFEKLLTIQEADARAQNPDKLAPKLQNLETGKLILMDIIKNKECYALKDLAISGRDLAKLGIKEGREIGHLLQLALDIVIKDPMLNEKEALLDKIQKYQSK